MRKCARFLDTSSVSRFENMVFRALIVLFSYGYRPNIETCKIIEATFLTLHSFALRDLFAGQRKGGMAQVSDCSGCAIEITFNVM